MKRNLKQLGIGMVTMLALAGMPRVAFAQVNGRPEPGPYPTPIIPYNPPQSIGLYGPPPTFVRPSAYTFNGPTPVTVNYVITTTNYYSPPTGGMAMNRFARTTYYPPIYGYRPGYYSDYYTPLFYRQ